MDPSIEASFMRFSVLQGPRRWAVILLSSIFIFFLVLLIWASFASLEEVTKGQGQVIASSKTQLVQNLEGGILKEILVKEGDSVTKGQVILRIDDTTAASTYRENITRYYSLLAASSRLKAESEISTAAEKPELVFSDELKKDRPDLVKTEIELFESRRNELKTSLSILSQQFDQRQKEIQELQSRESHLKTSLELGKEEAKILAPLVEKGVASRVELLRLQRDVNQLQSDLLATQVSISRAEVALLEAKEKIREREEQFRANALGELNETMSKISSLKESITAVKDRVTRTEIRSPVNGVVKQLHVHTVGEVVQPGESLVEIVPIEDNLLIEAKVSPADIAFLHPGQDAVVKVTAYDFLIYGSLKGKLEQISPDTIANQEGEQFYKIEVRTEKNYLGSSTKPLFIKPGMLVEVDILTGEKTVLQYLIKPIIRARHNALRER